MTMIVTQFLVLSLFKSFYFQTTSLSWVLAGKYLKIL